MSNPMNEAEHTSGPWRMMGNSGVSHFVETVVDIKSEESSVIVADCGISVDLSNDVKAANARLNAAAPAMDLLLKMIQRDIAGFSAGGGEFCFDGIRYDAIHGDWNRLVTVIGWEKARASLSHPRTPEGA